jgi:heme exporter protein C
MLSEREERSVNHAGGERAGPSLSDLSVAFPAVLGTLLGGWGLWLGLVVAPPERELGLSQKIFYLHAPIGIWTILLVVVAAAAGIAYLWRRRPAADLLGEAAMELTVVMSAVVLATGSLWARPAWGAWFPWEEPRVATFLVLLLLGVAYLVLRSSIDEPDRRARYSAVLAIVGAADAVLAYYAIRIWNTTHPRVISSEGVALQEDMKRAFFVCIGATFFLFWALLAARYRVGRLRHRLERLEHALDDRDAAPEASA